VVNPANGEGDGQVTETAVKGTRHPPSCLVSKN
jgi:hypothetical protein